MTTLRRWPCVVVLPALWATLAASLAAVQPAALEFQVSFDPAVSKEPFSGRVYVMLVRSVPGVQVEPRLGPNWFNPGPFFAKDVKNWKPGEPVAIGADALGFPGPIAKLPKGHYSIQAVMDFDRGARDFSNAEGNGYSSVVQMELDPASSGAVKLPIDQVVPAVAFPESDRVKLVDIESKLLSRFHSRPVHLRAGVVLPESYERQPGGRYPVVYEIPGFSGTHFGALQGARRNATDVAGTEMIYVVLDPDCRLGHHVFADSGNNGPCGQALITELMPHIEQQFRAIPGPAARFLTGHSSGGWSSLWLQIAYPDFFGGVWSTSPDPVDFRDFQRINLYEPGTNMFVNTAGQPRPLARLGGQPVLFFKPFSDMEQVMGHGGQLESFEAVFSPAENPDGKPRKLWDRDTGAIDPAVAESWKRYDIRLVLEENWKTLGPKLAGKLHVFTGSEDTFYLDGAVVLLKESLAKLGSDAVVEIIPGRDHSNLRDAEFQARIEREMAKALRRDHPVPPATAAGARRSIRVHVPDPRSSAFSSPASCGTLHF